MEKLLETFIKSLEGIWKSQQTIYDFTTKTSNTDKLHIKVYLPSKINIKQDFCSYICQYKQENNKKIVYRYFSLHKLYPISGTVQKIYKNVTIKYTFTLYNRHHLKIQYLNGNVLYTEYVYFIHKNVKLSMVTIKQLNQYTITCFTSDIRIIKT